METRHTCPRAHTRVNRERSRFPPCRSHQDPVLVVVPPPRRCALPGMRLKNSEPERSPWPSRGKAPGCPSRAGSGPCSGLSVRGVHALPRATHCSSPPQARSLGSPAPARHLFRRFPRLRPLQHQSASAFPPGSRRSARAQGPAGPSSPAVLLGQEAGRWGPVHSPASLAGSGAVRPCVRILRRKEGLYPHKTRCASPVPGAVGRRLSITWDCSGQRPSHQPGPGAPTPVSTPGGTSGQDLGVHVNTVPPASPCPQPSRAST